MSKIISNIDYLGAIMFDPWYIDFVREASHINWSNQKLNLKTLKRPLLNINKSCHVGLIVVK